jgi:uncharacterized membrane protein
MNLKIADAYSTRTFFKIAYIFKSIGYEVGVIFRGEISELPFVTAMKWGAIFVARLDGCCIGLFKQFVG